MIRPCRVKQYALGAPHEVTERLWVVWRPSMTSARTLRVSGLRFALEPLNHCADIHCPNVMMTWIFGAAAAAVVLSAAEARLGMGP